MNPPMLAAFLSLLLAASGSHAATQPSLPTLEAPVYATHVDSEIDVGRDGSITRYEPVTPIKGPLASRLRAVVERFRFHPVLVDGTPVPARSRMRIRLVAKPTADGDVQVSIERVGFPGVENPDGTSGSEHGMVRGVAKRVDVTYPYKVLKLGVTGRVVVAVRLDRGGHVVDAVARQSALFNTTGREKVLAGALEALERNAVEAIRQWRFKMDIPDSSHPEADELTGLVPVTFAIEEEGEEIPGKWIHETRTAERPLPWLAPAVAQALPDMSEVDDSGYFGTRPHRLRLSEPVEGMTL